MVLFSSDSTFTLCGLVLLPVAWQRSKMTEISWDWCSLIRVLDKGKGPGGLANVIALMHVYVTQANFTTKPRFEIKNKRSFTEMNSKGSRVEKNIHAQKVQMGTPNRSHYQYPVLRCDPVFG